MLSGFHAMSPALLSSIMVLAKGGILGVIPLMKGTSPLRPLCVCQLSPHRSPLRCLVRRPPVVHTGYANAPTTSAKHLEASFGATSAKPLYSLKRTGPVSQKYHQ